MRMTQIEQVLTIAAEGSLSKAAQKLFLSQPNLSQSLKKLELELGAQLFERNGRGVVATHFGREFIEFAQPTYRQFKLLKEFCRHLDEATPLTLNIASQHLRFANMVFIDFCNNYRQEPYRFSFIEGSFQDILELVRSQEAEVGLVVLSNTQQKIMNAMFKKSNLEYYHLATEEVAIIVRKGHPLCEGGRSTVTVAELAKYAFATYTDMHYSLTPEWNILGVDDAYQKITVRDRSTLYELLGNTDAYSVGVHNRSAYANTQYYSDKQVLYLSDEHLTLEIGYLINKCRPISHLATLYLEEIKRITK